MSLLRDLRRRHDPMPVLIVTARDEVADRIAGSTKGPMTMCSSRSIWTSWSPGCARSCGGALAPGCRCWECGSLVLDPVRREVRLGGVPVGLSAKEFALLETLMRRPGAGAFARTAGERDLRLAAGDRQQCGRGPSAQPAPQARARHHPQRSRGRLQGRSPLTGAAHAAWPLQFANACSFGSWAPCWRAPAC